MKKIITESDLEQHAKDGVFVVTHDMILTPFARDHAVHKGIRLEYAAKNAEEAGAPGQQNSLENAIRDIVLAELGEVGEDVRATLEEEIHRSLTNTPISGGTTPPSTPPQNTAKPLETQGASANIGKRAVVTTTGLNKTGIVAGITSAISSAGGDIQDISQTLTGDYFTMIMVVDLSVMASHGITFHAFREQLSEAAKTLGVDLTMMHEDILNSMHRI